MRILCIGNYTHCCFRCDLTHFSVLSFSTNALYDFYSGIVNPLIFIH